MVKRRRHPVPSFELSAFVGFRFPPEVICWLCGGISGSGCRIATSRSFSAERAIDVDHVTLFRWVQRFIPALIDAAIPCRHTVDSRWFVDETVRAGSWTKPT